MTGPERPDGVEWVSPRPGHWRRDFRMGEWLPAPVTPSFETWFLPRFEQGFSDASEEVYSVRMALPLHVLVNGWYFTNEGKMEGLVRGVAKHPVYLVRWSLAMATIATRPDLSPPLAIGKPSGPWRRMAEVPSRYRAESESESESQADDDHVSILGIPTSPGVATGPAVIVRDLDDFDKVRPGDVLIAPITAPAWTPLFTLAAAVVTDGGSVFAHASVVAREYGIPAVVAAEHATASFRDGDLVTVDGETGVVSTPH